VNGTKKLTWFPEKIRHFFSKNTYYTLLALPKLPNLFQAQKYSMLVQAVVSPGIPLAIMFPDSEFLLVDSISKKIRVVEDVLNQLNIKNAKGQNTRAENLNEKFDFIVSRAVAAFPIFYNWVNKNISKTNYNLLKNGILYLKGGDLREEMKEFSPHYMEFNLSEFFTEEFFETKKIIYLPKNRN
jgi:16S rRNA (guanine527-N7)-methyltransferase